MRAEVIAVGSEMLTPTHVDTNSLFITERLNEIGIDLQGKAVAGDDRGVLKAIVLDALGRSDLLILTGGSARPTTISHATLSRILSDGRSSITRRSSKRSKSDSRPAGS